MKWYDPNERVLEMVGLENTWAKEEKTDDPTLQGKSSTILDQLHHRRLIRTSKSYEGPFIKSLALQKGMPVLNLSPVSTHPFLLKLVFLL